MRFGVVLAPTTSVAETSRRARRIEQLGFDEVWLTDHYYNRDIASVGAAVALATHQIRIGLGACSPHLRHPALLASMYSTLQEMSEGRITLAIGSGGSEYGRQIGPAAMSPLESVDACVRIVATLSSGGVSTTKAKQVFTHDAQLELPSDFPARILVSARGPRMLKLGWSVGSGVLTHGVRPEYLRTALSLRSEQEGTPACITEIQKELVVSTVCVVRESPDAVDSSMYEGALLMIGGEYPASILPQLGLTLDAVQDVRRAVRRGDYELGTSLLTDEMLDAVAVIGTEQQVVRRFKQLDDLGVDSLLISGKGLKGPVFDDQLGRIANLIAAIR